MEVHIQKTNLVLYQIQALPVSVYESVFDSQAITLLQAVMSLFEHRGVSSIEAPLTFENIDKIVSNCYFKYAAACSVLMMLA